MKTLANISAALVLLAASEAYAGELLVIVNDSNPVGAMIVSEVKKHFLKDKARWDFGQKVRPADSTYNGAARDAFLSNVLGMNALELVQMRAGVRPQDFLVGRRPWLQVQDLARERGEGLVDGVEALRPLRVSWRGVLAKTRIADESGARLRHVGVARR